ncbi:MAG: EI24 domain-containing protein [Desulfopila sp.]
MKSSHRPSGRPQWYPLSYCFSLIFRQKRLLAWSTVLFLATITLTTLGYQLSVEHVDRFAGSFLIDPPAATTIWGWIKFQGWKVAKVLFFIITRIVAFYLAFLLAYTLTSPGYSFLSQAAEKLHAGEHFIPDEGMLLLNILIDIFEGLKIALFGVFITIVALVLNFIPGLGQGVVLLLYAFYSALMFVDYPSSRRHWSLGRKISWIRTHSGTALRLGLLPAVLSMVPLLNVFLMSLFFPLLTIHATLNFTSIELGKRQVTAPPQ